MNTIKQAKVNVRDKISFLEVSNSPVIAVADRSSKLPTHKPAGSDNQLIEKTHQVRDNCAVHDMLCLPYQSIPGKVLLTHQ